MLVEVVDQFAGDEPVSRILNEHLASDEWSRFRFLVAFARWSGLSLIHEELEAFAQRGSSIDGIVGIDLGGTTAEALTYLSSLPNSRLRVVASGNPRIVFHPKVYFFDSADSWAVLVGSSNLSMGGLFSNAEAGILCTGDVGEPNPFEKSWLRYNEPLPPLQPTNIIEVDKANLDKLAQHLEPFSKRPPDRSGESGLEGVPPVRSPSFPPVGRPPIPFGSGSPPPIVAAPEAIGEVLYLELWNETGTSGTQVQIPQVVAENYFGLAAGTVTWLSLSTPEGVTRVQLTSFENITYRISLSFTADVPRPAVLRFERTGTDSYTVEVRHQSDADYPAWLAHCTERTRDSSKSYGYG